jgi:hypothetical protein
MKQAEGIADKWRRRATGDMKMNINLEAVCVDMWRKRSSEDEVELYKI